MGGRKPLLGKRQLGLLLVPHRSQAQVSSIIKIRTPSLKEENGCTEAGSSCSGCSGKPGALITLTGGFLRFEGPFS